MRAGAVIDYRLRVSGIPIWQIGFSEDDGSSADAKTNRRQSRTCFANVLRITRSTCRVRNPVNGLVADTGGVYPRVAQRNSCVYCARNALIGSTLVARSAGM